MNVIIMYVILISGTWETYAIAQDSQMGPVETLDDCVREGELLLERRGDISRWACMEGGDPGHLILPPYQWPKVIFREYR